MLCLNVTNILIIGKNGVPKYGSKSTGNRTSGGRSQTDYDRDVYRRRLRRDGQMVLTVAAAVCFARSLYDAACVFV